MYAPDAAGSKGGGSKHVIGCSIDPTQEGLARMQAFLRQVGVTATPNDTDRIVNGLRESLGLQNVSILGVSANTHFAQVMVEADYRMKLIGIGLEQPPIRMASYVQTAQPADVSRNAMQRWYFVPDYECVRVSDDGLAMELVGDGVKLVSDDEVVTGDGVRQGRSGRQGQPDVRHELHEAVRRFGPAIARVRPAAQPDRHRHCRRLYQGQRPLQRRRLGPGSAGRRVARLGRASRCGSAGADGGGERLAWQPVDDAGRRRCPHRAGNGPERRNAARRRRQAGRCVATRGSNWRTGSGGGTESSWWSWPRGDVANHDVARSTSATRRSQTLVCVGPVLIRPPVAAKNV
ncbi:MAG: DUF1598 domain-containing protein [Pirellulales bacterium]